MADKRDELQAHLFVVGRLISAVVRGSPDVSEPPLRRSTIGTLAGLLITILALVAVGLVGYLHPGHNSSWRVDNAVVVEKDTGTRYLYLSGQLHPTLNVTSARLASGGTSVHVVSSKSLAGTEHGAPIGIPGAPDWLPGPKALLTGSWAICAYHRAAPATGDGFELGVGSALPIATVPSGQALLVKTPDQVTWLIAAGHRYKLSGGLVLTSLGYQASDAIGVPGPWLNAVPPGPDIYIPDVPNRGRPGSSFDGRVSRVGQVIRNQTPNGVQNYYLNLSDGLLAVGQTEADLQLGNPAIKAAYPDRAPVPIDISTAALAAAPKSAKTALGTGWPAQPPVLATNPTRGQRPCLQFGFAQTGLTVTAAISSTPPAAPSDGPGPAQSQSADAVRLPPGEGVLAQAQAGPSVSTGTLYAITDRGIRYPIPDAANASALGFGGAVPVPVPTSVLALIPVGPALDPAGARALHPSVTGS